MKERYKFLGAVYLMLIKENQILLQRRYNTGYADGLYSFPAGHIEENETFLYATKREVEEEAGIIINEKDIKLFTVMQRKVDFGTYIDFFSVIDKWDGEPYTAEEDKCDDTIWCNIDNLPENTIPHVKKAVFNYLNNINYNIEM